MTFPEYSDLIGVPYKLHGRTKEGLDCYGLVLEIYRRAGLTLADLEYTSNDISLCDKYAPTLNVQEIENPECLAILQVTLNNELHIGVCINERLFLHSTYNQGVRISPIKAYKGARFFNGRNQSL